MPSRFVLVCVPGHSDSRPFISGLKDPKAEATIEKSHFVLSCAQSAADKDGDQFLMLFISVSVCACTKGLHTGLSPISVEAIYRHCVPDSANIGNDHFRRVQSPRLQWIVVSYLIFQKGRNASKVLVQTIEILLREEDLGAQSSYLDNLVKKGNCRPCQSQNQKASIIWPLLPITSLEKKCNFNNDRAALVIKPRTVSIFLIVFRTISNKLLYRSNTWTGLCAYQLTPSWSLVATIRFMHSSDQTFSHKPEETMVEQIGGFSPVEVANQYLPVYENGL